MKRDYKYDTAAPSTAPDRLRVDTTNAKYVDLEMETDTEWTKVVLKDRTKVAALIEQLTDLIEQLTEWYNRGT